MRCNIGGRMARHKFVTSNDISSTRRTSTRGAIRKEDICPFKLIAHKRTPKGQVGGWEITTMELQHNHPQDPTMTMHYQNGLSDLTTEQRTFLSKLLESSLEPKDILQAFKKMHPNAPNLSTQDIQNMRRGGGQMMPITCLSS